MSGHGSLGGADLPSALRFCTRTFHPCPSLQSGLSSLVLRKKRALTSAFTQVDKEGNGYVTKDKWCKVMDNVSGLPFDLPPSMTMVVIDR